MTPPPKFLAKFCVSPFLSNAKGHAGRYQNLTPSANQICLHPSIWASVLTVTFWCPFQVTDGCHAGENLRALWNWVGGRELNVSPAVPEPNRAEFGSFENAKLADGFNRVFRARWTKSTPNNGRNTRTRMRLVLTYQRDVQTRGVLILRRA